MEQGLNELIQRIHKHVKQDIDCWIWVGGTQARHQTPAMSWKGQVGNVRRFILIEHGVPMKGFFATNSCKNPLCVNPDHVKRTTRKLLSVEAAAAMDVAKKTLHAMRTSRALRNSSERSIKLTQELVNAIRADERPQRVIAAEYGIAQRTVYSVKHHKIWRDYQAVAANPFAQLMR